LSGELLQEKFKLICNNSPLNEEVHTYQRSNDLLKLITTRRMEHQMPNIDINSPVSSAPTDRLALGVGWVRPGVAGIGGTLNPSYHTYTGGIGHCFEGNEE
jgi:hypothetical protein